MQIGRRWRFTEPAPTSIPAAMLPVLQRIEAASATPDYWTLTYLEGKPVLTSDAGVQIRMDASGRVIESTTAQDLDDTDDDWLQD